MDSSVSSEAGWYERYVTIRDIANGRPSVENLPVLRAALYDDHDVTAKEAASALKKLGSKAAEATNDLIAAATRPWKYGCPQIFPYAVEALLRIAPAHPRLTEICQHALTCQNYGIQKAAVVSLAKIGTSEAQDIFRNVDRFRDVNIQCKHWDNLMAKILASLKAPSKSE